MAVESDYIDTPRPLDHNNSTLCMMFRNPRENASRLPDEHVKASLGRPPSLAATTDESPNRNIAFNMPVETARALQPPKLGSPTSINNSTTKNGKGKAKNNSSILSFFKKTENSGGDASLFIEDKSAASDGSALSDIDGIAYRPQRSGVQGEDEESRFNESPNSIKRRKTSHDLGASCGDLVTDGNTADIGEQHRELSTSRQDEGQTLQGSKADEPPDDEAYNQVQPTRSGPFVDASDSEEEDDVKQEKESNIKTERMTVESEPPNLASSTSLQDGPPIKALPHDELQHVRQTPPLVPMLKREGTSIVEEDGFADFEGMEDFDDDYEEGDEYIERRYMREQRRLEAEAGDGNVSDDDDLIGAEAETHRSVVDEASEPAEQPDEVREGVASSCPICSISLAGVTDQEASVHVNHCLDGNPTPLPVVKKQESTPEASTTAQPRRFVRPPKPGQQNPFSLGQSSAGGSAFSKLMSGHSEETAWSAAAASERESRGKPAFTRTCPFYKILPGFYTCVDAFRYGAVAGCNAYFLSHFHSDHYIGLTSTWSHGKIYCSHITANLVRQQLRVDPKWVVDLEWEQNVEVAGTDGVHVTMIPANHCPGSSLFLFEKILNPPTSAPSSAKPGTQRVLHCGDFRACPAHIAHPKLAPEVVDSITGKLKRQKIDVCYLDTTYLSPKYAFPSQEEVIEACADMCVSLSKHKVDQGDSYETMKRERAGSAMTKFVRKDSKEEAVTEPMIEDSERSKKPRGRLLVVVGTYSIGKERICLGIARALNSLIYAPAAKQRICAALKDPELNSRLTSDPLAASVHMTPLFEIRAETLSEYLETYNGHFGRAVGFRPSGWNYRPPGSRSTEAPTVQQVLYSPGWKSTYTMKNLMPQRGSSNKSAVYGVPYSEHSSFRELTMFICGLRIEKVIPTVNIGGAKSREKMRAWCERWAAEKRKNGLFRVKRPEDEDKAKGEVDGGDFYPGSGTWELRTTL